MLLAAQGIAAHRRQKGQLRDAAKCLLEALPGDPKRKLRPEASSNAWRRQPADAALVCKLLRALCNSEPAWAEQALQHCLAWPKTYGLDAVIVPAAHKLLETPDLRKHAVVQQLAAAARQHLAARVSLPLAPPPNWRRAADVNCHCVHCKGLISFLKSDTDAVWRFKAKETERSHVAASIQGARCDVDCIIERKGSPHVLVCTKNQASFERRVKQRQEDLRHLQGLGKPGV